MVLSGRVPDADGPSAALMEIGLEGRTATLVAIADGSTSLYLSNGGGVIGAGEHASVREAASAFLRSASDHSDKLEATTDQPLPAAGSVRFYVNNGGSLRTAEAEEEEPAGEAAQQAETECALRTGGIGDGRSSNC